MAKDDELKQEIKHIINTWTKGYDANVEMAVKQILVIVKREQSELYKEMAELIER